MTDTSTTIPESTQPVSGPGLRQINWVWFAERTGGTACELGTNGVPGDSRLEHLFADVYRADSPRQIADRLGNEVVDAVVVQDFQGERSASPRVQFFHDCHRILRPGGYVVFCVDYSWWYRRLVPPIQRTGGNGSVSGDEPPSCDIRTARRWLREAGFAPVRCYLGDGNPTDLRVVVPVSGTSLVGTERINGRSRPRQAVRLILTKIGLGPLFYRTLLVFGYK